MPKSDLYNRCCSSRINFDQLYRLSPFFTKRSLALIMIISATDSSFAQSGKNTVEVYDEALKNSSTINSVDSSVFGDSTSLLDGSTNFYQTDIDLKTNSGLRVTLSRKLSLNAREFRIYGGAGNNDPFQLFDSSWQLDIPRISGIAAPNSGVANQKSGLFKSNRCASGAGSAGDVYGTANFYNTVFSSYDYSNGSTINIPGHGEQQIWSLAPEYPRPDDGVRYGLTTKSRILISCLQSIKNGEGEGFVALLEDGTRYFFDWIAVSPAEPVIASYCSSVIKYPGPAPCQQQVALIRERVTLYATKVVDRFNNRVDYNYDSANPHRLLSMVSSDGVRIDLTYNSFGKIQSAGYSGRVWSYSSNSVVFTVNNPDGGRWVTTYSGAYSSLSQSDFASLWRNSCTVNVGTKSSSSNPNSSDVGYVTMESPGGVIGKFLFRKLVHGSNNTGGGCTIVASGGSQPIYRPLFEGTPKAYQAISLYEKSISGVGLIPQLWTYKYYPTWSWIEECESPKVCKNSSKTIVTNPDGSIASYTFGNDSFKNYSNFIEMTLQSSNYSQLEKSSKTYLQSVAGQPFPDRYSYPGGRDHFYNGLNRPEISIKKIRDGIEFNESVEEFDRFMRAVKITKFSKSSP